MARKRENEFVRCKHFCWLLKQRDGVWQADGRSNPSDAGRHSLGTRDRQEALSNLYDLDLVRAEDLGLVQRSSRPTDHHRILPLSDGRTLYEKHLSRPALMGGVRKSTQKRYRTVFDKFLQFCEEHVIQSWNAVWKETLLDYATSLEKKNRMPKTIETELTTIKQTVKWLIDEGHLPGKEPIVLPLKKANSQRAYCYSPEEISAMLVHCRQNSELAWLEEIVVALACTGMRISELASLRWSDVMLDTGMIRLTDEGGQYREDVGEGRRLKSGRSRSFPIHDDLRSMLNAKKRSGSPYIFLGPRGGRLNPDTVRTNLVNRVIKPVAAKTKVVKGDRTLAAGRLHSFRHYFCSQCANNNVPERIVMDWLGHASSDMIRYYFHLHDDESRRHMSKLDFLGTEGGRSAGETRGSFLDEETELE